MRIFAGIGGIEEETLIQFNQFGSELGVKLKLGVESSPKGQTRVPTKS